MRVSSFLAKQRAVYSDRVGFGIKVAETQQWAIEEDGEEDSDGKR